MRSKNDKRTAYMKLIKAQDASSQPVSHSPEIQKSVYINDDEIPGLTNFSSAVLKPGDAVGTHSHDTKYEIFYVEKGELECIVNGKTYIVHGGDTLYVEPNESHELTNKGKFPARIIYFGVSTV